MRRLIGALVIATSLFAAAPAEARVEWIIDKTYRTDRPMHIDVVAFAWPFGISRFGASGWFGFPLLEQGFTPLNDVLDVEVGAYFVHMGDAINYFAIGPAGGLRWGVDLTEDWQAFIAAKAGWRIGLGDDAADNDIILSFSLGALWEFSDSMYLRLETGNYGIIQAGVTIPF